MSIFLYLNIHDIMRAKLDRFGHVCKDLARETRDAESLLNEVLLRVSQYYRIKQMRLSMIINITKDSGDDAMKYLLDREPPPGESAGRKSLCPFHIRDRIDTAFRHSFKWTVNLIIPIASRS